MYGEQIDCLKEDHYLSYEKRIYFGLSILTVPLISSSRQTLVSNLLALTFDQIDTTFVSFKKTLEYDSG